MKILRYYEIIKRQMYIIFKFLYRTPKRFRRKFWETNLDNKYYGHYTIFIKYTGVILPYKINGEVQHGWSPHSGLIDPNTPIRDIKERRYYLMNEFNQKKSFDQILYKTVLPGIGWIAKKKVIKKYKFNLKYKVASDYDLLLKFYKNNFHFYRIYNSIYYFRLGVGTSFKLAKLSFKEQKDIALINNGPKLKIFYIYILYNIKYFLKYKLLKYFI